MKKTLAMLLSICLLTVCIPLAAAAESNEPAGHILVV